MLTFSDKHTEALAVLVNDVLPQVEALEDVSHRPHHEFGPGQYLDFSCKYVNYGEQLPTFACLGGWALMHPYFADCHGSLTALKLKCGLLHQGKDQVPGPFGDRDIFGMAAGLAWRAEYLREELARRLEEVRHAA